MTEKLEEKKRGYFLINDKIEFHPEKKTLTDTCTNSETLLFITASRCLELLITHQGEVITQRDLMSYGWNEQGREVSPNTFYQNISSLRKAFSEMMPEQDVIVTVKRVGLFFSNELSIEFVNDDHQKTETEDTDTRSDQKVTGIMQRHEDAGKTRVSVGKYASFLKKSWFALWLLLILVLLIPEAKKTPLLKVSTETSDTIFKNYTLLRQVGDTCNIYINNNYGADNKINPQIKTDDLDCNGYSNVYVTSFKNYGTSSIMYCSIENKKLKSCTTEYFTRNDK